MRADRFARWVTGGFGIFMLALGLWSLLGPESFFDRLATFEPYNRHFLHDIGAFQAAIGATLLVALLTTDALMVALAGGGIAAVLHFVAHVADRDLGGRGGDPVLLGIVAAVVVGAACVRFVQGRHASGARRGARGLPPPT